MKTGKFSRFIHPLLKKPWFWLVAVALLACIEMAGLSLARYIGFNMRGFDLGSVGQAIWSVTQGDPLIVTSIGRPVSRLAGNAELFYLLLAPYYALFPSPVSLLVMQAVLYALGAGSLYRLARRRLQSGRAALIVAIIYLLYPVAQTAVLFSFHGDTLAMPLLLFAIDALDRRAWRSYAFWLLLALSCKFYVAVPVAVMGFTLWLNGHRRVGWLTALLGLVWGAAIFFVVRPLFASVESLPVAEANGVIRFYNVTFGQFNLIRFSAGQRLANALIVFMPILLLGWRAASWLLPAGAIVLPVLLSNGPGPVFDYRYHHYAVAVPFLLASLVYGTEKMMERRQSVENGRLPGYLKLCLIITLIFNIAFVDTPLSPIFYTAAPGSAMGLDSNGYHVSARDRFKRQWLANTVSPDAPLLTDRVLGLALLNRDILYIDNQLSRPLVEAATEVEEVALDALFDFSWLTANQFNVAGVTSDHKAIRFMLAESDFDLAAARDGLLHFARTGSGLQTEVEIRPFPKTPIQHQFGDSIGLVDVQIEALGGNHFQIQVDWMALRPLTDTPPLIAVSRPEGLEQARIVHLPTLALLPTTEWPTDQIIRETFEFTLPDDAASGQYPLYLGWYDTSSLYAAETDARSRLGDEVRIGTLTIP